MDDASPGGETSNPTCSNSATSDDPERRFLYAAVINCVSDLSGGNNVDVPVVAYAKLFLTEPVAEIDTSRDAIYAELHLRIEMICYSTMWALLAPTTRYRQTRPSRLPTRMVTVLVTLMRLSG